MPADEQLDPLTCHYDIFPTLCDLAGIDSPGAVEGETLVPTFRDGADRARDSLLLAYEDIHRAVRDERFKLIEYYVDGDWRTQLFDLDADPAETK